MSKNLKRTGRAIGVVGAAACTVIFVAHPSFPTPDKLMIFLIFLFAGFNQGWAMFKRIFPFVAVILVYESFRSVVPQLNSHVNYALAPRLDRFIFGSLPTADLQKWWWHGQVHWYDIVLYIPYLIFFVAPLALAILIWKTRERYYWRAVCAYSLLFFMSFVTFLLLPTAPPWLASSKHFIQPITRISSNVWAAIGIGNFPSVYNHLSPNPVAAFPSLHSGASTLFSLIVFKLYGRRWGAISLIYPILIYIGVVYEGEHYASDVIAGIIYALVAYFAAGYILRACQRLAEIVKAYSSSTKTALRSRQ